MNLLLPSPLLANGLEFGWRQSTTVGLVICAVLAVMSVVSWTAMIAKIVLLSRAKRANAEFIANFRSALHPLAMFQNGEHFDFAPYYHIYHEAARELSFHLVGSDQPDRTFGTRLQGAGRISPSQMESVHVALERSVGEAALKFEHGLSMVSIALSGAPFIGLLGTVWGVMDSFAELANNQGASSIQAMAPGVCAALLTTVVGLLVAIPSMFGYNVLVTRIREMVVRMDNFASELSSTFDRRYVDHRSKSADEQLPSVGTLGSPKTVVSSTSQPSSPASPGPRTMPPPSRQPVTAAGG